MIGSRMHSAQPYSSSISFLALIGRTEAFLDTSRLNSYMALSMMFPYKSGIHSWFVHLLLPSEQRQ